MADHKRITVSPGVVEAMLGDLRTPLYEEHLKAPRRILGSFGQRIEVPRERGRITYSFPLKGVLVSKFMPPAEFE